MEIYQIMLIKRGEAFVRKYDLGSLAYHTIEDGVICLQLNLDYRDVVVTMHSTSLGDHEQYMAQNQKGAG